MERYLTFFFDQGSEQFLTLGVSLILWAGLTALGGLIAGPGRVREGAFVYGWGIAALVVTAGAVLLDLPLSFGSWAMVAVAAGAAVFVYRHDGALAPAGMVKAGVLTLPLLLIAAAMLPSQWDEFSHWLPAARFLLETDAFPGRDNPVTGTPMLPAYPYNWPLLTYWASLLGGGLVEGASRIVNVLLLISVGMMALRLVLRAAGHGEPEAVGWRLAAVAVMAGTLLNPSFIQKIVLTAYADVPTAAVTALSAFLGWKLLDALGRGDGDEARSLAWQYGLATLALINIKQVNLVHFAVVLAGIGLAALRDPEVRLADLLKRLPVMLVLPLAAYGMWRWYVGTEMADWGGAEASFMAFEDWNIGVIPGILAQMLVVAGKKIGHFGIMAVAVVFALRGLIRYRGEFDRLAIIVATAFVGYTAFMLFIYVSSFAEKDALRVVSFWRYSTHMALLTVLFGAYGVGLLWKRHVAGRRLFRGATAVPLVLVLAAPFIFAPKLRFDFEPPKPRVNAAGKFLEKNLPEDAGLRVLDPRGNGESSVITRYRVDRRNIPFTTYRSLQRVDEIRDFVAPLQPGDWLVVHSVTPETEEALGLDLTRETSYLLIRRAEGWEKRRAWRFDGTLKAWTPGEA